MFLLIHWHLFTASVKVRSASHSVLSHSLVLDIEHNLVMDRSAALQIYMFWLSAATGKYIVCLANIVVKYLHYCVRLFFIVSVFENRFPHHLQSAFPVDLTSDSFTLFVTCCWTTPS